MSPQRAAFLVAATCFPSVQGVRMLLPPFMSLVVQSSTGIFMHVRPEQEMERTLSAQNGFVLKSLRAPDRR